MKKILLAGILAYAGISAKAQLGLEGIIVEKFYVSDAADSIDADENFATYPLHVGSVTYRVYADLLPGYEVIQMFGSTDHPMEVETTTSFYNDPNYGFNIYQGISVVNTKKHTTLVDSYFTIGGVAAGLMGVLKTEDTDGTIGNTQGILANDDASIGAPITGADGKDGLMPGEPVVPNTLGFTTELDIFDQTPGSSFATTGGTIVALGGVMGVTEANHVLLGQFTTDGTFSFKLNIQIGTPVKGESQLFVAENPVEGENTDTTLTYMSPPPALGIGEIITAQSNDFILYPNPCEDMIILQKTSADIDRNNISILDMTGRIVYTSVYTSGAKQIDTSGLPQGIYTVRMDKKSGAETVKFIKR